MPRLRAEGRRVGARRQGIWQHADIHHPIGTLAHHPISTLIIMSPIDYIIQFLLGEAAGACRPLVGYTSDAAQWGRYRVVMVPSGFFRDEVYGTAASLPALPLPAWEGVPFLFGEPRVEQVGGTLVVYADLVASAYFLLSRYEEMVRRGVRDVHGRFPGRGSVPARGGFIHRPVVDEYGVLLRGWLRQAGVEVDEPLAGIRRVYLTHDVDSLAHYRRLRGVAGALLRHRPEEVWQAVRTYVGRLESDPWYTFPWLLEQDGRIDAARREVLFFVKPGGGDSREDQPHSHVRGGDFRRLFRLLRESGATVGLHASYEAGRRPGLVAREKALLEVAWGGSIACNRHHYLDTREPEHMQALLDAGIGHDFTLGYADVAGFRLGTCRAVRWINPATRQVTGLVLHPLTVMDGTLDGEQYMGLDEETAFGYVAELLVQTARCGGDVCLLWHNTSVARPYHRQLYPKIIGYLADRLGLGGCE